MTALELYKFVTSNKCEYHWNEEDVLLFISIYDIKEFNEMLGASVLDEAGIVCNMKDGYFVFRMNDICEYFGIELLDVFTKS